MNIMKQDVIHYPNLKTVLMIEEVLKNAELAMTKTEIKKRLPNLIMHQTLNIVLEYLEERGMIAFTSKGIIWIYNPSPKLDAAIRRGVEV